MTSGKAGDGGGTAERVALVLGARGLLGRELAPALEQAGWRVLALTHAEVDVTDADGVKKALGPLERSAARAVVVNCAAYTRVDDAERNEARAFEVNATGAGNVARAAREVGARHVLLSTDYVFDGQARQPYAEDAPTAPLGAYARSKLAGEMEARAAGGHGQIVRTGELYGTGGPSFFAAIFARTREGRARVVNDQTVSPTWTRELARQLVTLVDADAPAGTYHATAEGEVTWFEAARAALTLAGRDPSVIDPVSTAEWGSPTPRPPYSVLGHGALQALGLYRMRPWHLALAEWIATAPP